MNPDDIIDRLSRRYGVSTDFGEKLRPLILRALSSSPEARKRILDMVERSYAHQARLDLLRGDVSAEPSQEALDAVARILHGWNPPDWLQRWSDLHDRGTGS